MVEKSPELTTLNEAYVTAETLARATTISDDPGYYTKIPGEEDRALDNKRKDRKKLKTNDNYSDHTYNNFLRTHISHLKMGKSKINAARMFRKLRK